MPYIFSLTCMTLFSKLLHSRPSTPTSVWVKCCRDCVKRLIECQLRWHQQSVCHCDLADNIAWHLSAVGNLYHVYCWVFIHKSIRVVVDIPIIIPTHNASVLQQKKSLIPFEQFHAVLSNMPYNARTRFSYFWKVCMALITVLTIAYATQGTFWIWAQPMRDDITL